MFSNLELLQDKINNVKTTNHSIVYIYNHYNHDIKYTNAIDFVSDIFPTW